MKTQDAQRKPLGDWKKGRPLTGDNLQESIKVIRDLKDTLNAPQGVNTQTVGFRLYRVTEAVDLTLSPLTWEIKAVLVNDTLNSDTPPLLQAITEEIVMKVPGGTYGVAIGDLVTKAFGAKVTTSRLVVPINPAPLVYKATADELLGEITGAAMLLDLTTTGAERTFKVFPTV
jgi:hypothetical protein